jgi:hypothetical protein
MKQICMYKYKCSLVIANIGGNYPKAKHHQLAASKQREVRSVSEFKFQDGLHSPGGISP